MDPLDVKVSNAISVVDLYTPQTRHILPVVDHYDHRQ